MAANQPQWPREWLMTDERLGDRLWQAIDALPAGAGIVFRHYATAGQERDRLARRVSELCRERALVLAIARDVALASSLDAELIHNPAGTSGDLPFSRSAHSLVEARSAWADGASLIFLSPLFSTRSHPGLEPLPRDVARHIAATSPIPVIALGGMDRQRFEQRKADGFYGWAGIDAWLGERPRI